LVKAVQRTEDIETRKKITEQQQLYDALLKRLNIGKKIMDERQVRKEFGPRRGPELSNLDF